jgi:hypothetical protein
MKTAFYCTLIVCFIALAHPVGAAEGPEQLVAAVPAEVSEVVSGGSWSEGSTNGVYRAMVVSTPSGSAPQANVVVQMLAVESATSVPKVVKTVMIKEVADKKLANAFLAMDAETDNEMTLIVTAYGAATDQDTSVHVKFNGSGAYEILPAPGEDPAPASAEKKK